MSSREKDEANVQILLRCKPLRNDGPQVVTCNDSLRQVAVSQTIAGKQINKVFTFDKVFGPSTEQKDLYDKAVVPIVNDVLEGFNCTIFAYGQTGTGKTYTMEGECGRAKSGPNGQLPSAAGVIPRAAKQIFDTLESQNAEYGVKVTFFELHNEEITDLLAPVELSKVALGEKRKKLLPLMKDGKGGVLVRGLEEVIVTSACEILSLLERGSSKRQAAERLLNKQSRWSHSLFSITIHINEATPEGEELIKCGKLNLVDLAGWDRSGAREGRAKEAGKINKSLLALGRVITALVEHLGYIPYRDNKLTHLLRDSLGGRTKTYVIATVSPSVRCLEETLRTLDHVHRAKDIKNWPEVNQKTMKSALIEDLNGEIDRLKAELHSTREQYSREESERKAMAEQMGILLETKEKQLEDLQEKYNEQLQLTADLREQLVATEKSLNHTNKSLATAKEELKQSRNTLREKDFVISEQMKAHEEQLRSEEDKLIADMTSLIYSGMLPQQELVNKRIFQLGDAASKANTRFDERMSYVEHVTADARRKWEEFSKKAQHDSKDGSDFSAAKHCRMELVLQQCASTVDAAAQQRKKTHASVDEMSSKHVVDLDALVRAAIENNEQHHTDVVSACIVAEEDTTRMSEDMQLHIENVLEKERILTKGALAAGEAHSMTLQQLWEDHTNKAADINRHAENTFRNTYMDYDPSGETPTRSEPDVPSRGIIESLRAVPSRGTIESLRAVPMNTPLEEFRENNPYGSSKDKPLLRTRSPLIQLN